MSRRVLLLEIGAGDLPAATPTPQTASSWFPTPYVAPPPLAPGGFALASIVGGVRASWNAVAGANVTYELQRAPDASGAPGTAQSVYVGTVLVYNSNESAKTWWRVRTVVRGVPSGWTAWASATPQAVATPADVSAVQDAADAAKAAADAAQSTANTANTTANTAGGLATQAPIINGGFDATPYGTGWTADAGWTFKSDGAGPGVGPGYAQFNATGSNAAIKNNGRVGVVAGQTYKTQALIRGVNSPNGVAYARISWQDASGAEIAHKSGNTITGNVVAGSFALDQAPAGAFYAATWVEIDGCTTGIYQVDNVVATLQPSNVGEVPDGGGRYAVNQVDANGLAVVDFSQPGHVNKTQSYIGDDANYRRVAASFTDTSNRPIGLYYGGLRTGDYFLARANGTGTQPLATISDAGALAGKNVANLDVDIADGTNFRRVGSGYVDTSGRPYRVFDATLGSYREGSYLGAGASRAWSGLDSDGTLTAGKHSFTRLLDRVADNVSETTGRKWSIYDAAAQTGIAQPGQNLMPNPTGALGFNGLPGFTWIGGSQQQMTTRNELFGAAGPMFSCAAPGTGTVDQGFTTTIPQVAAASPITVSADMDARVIASGGMFVELRFLNSSSAEINAANRPRITATNGQAQMKRYTITGTTEAATASIQVVVRFSGAMSSNSVIGWRNIKLEIGSVATPYQDNATQLGNLATVPNGGVKAYTDFSDNTAGGHVGKNQDNIADGGTYARIKGAELSSGVHKLGVAGSGYRLGDQRNTPSSLSRGYGAVRSVTALTVYSSGAVDVNAHTLTMGAAPINYNAVSNAVTGLTVGQTYQIYTRDNYAGGSPTWLATQSAATANSFDDAYIGGSITVPSSGSGGGGLPGGGGCVHVDSWLQPGVRAKHVRWWQRLDCAHRGKRYRRWQSWLARVRWEPCVKIVADGGAVLVCSIHTPFELRDGATMFARDMYGHEVLTEHGWRRVIDVIGVGIQPVMRIHVGGRSYAAGEDPTNRIYSHNPVK